jgi:hypothetical protein
MTPGASLADRACPPLHGAPASSFGGATSLDPSPAASALCEFALPSPDDPDDPDDCDDPASTAAWGCPPPS